MALNLGEAITQNSFVDIKFGNKYKNKEDLDTTQMMTLMFFLDRESFASDIDIDFDKYQE